MPYILTPTGTQELKTGEDVQRRMCLKIEFIAWIDNLCIFSTVIVFYMNSL